MPRPRPPRLVKQTTRHGAIVWYYRDGHGTRTRIRGVYSSPEFRAAYDAAAAGRPWSKFGAEPEKPRSSAQGTLSWLIGQYQRSAKWAEFKPATRKQREAIFRRMIAKAPEAPISGVTRKTIILTRDAHKETPAQANVIIKVMRGLFDWAVEAEFMSDNPAKGVPFLKVKSDGFHEWTAEELERFETVYPLGTRERLAYAVLLYTGQRRGDVVRMGRQHIGKDGLLFIRQEKTGKELYLPVLAPLREAIAAGPTGDLSFIVGARGEPMVKEAFGNWFHDRCVAAGLPECAAHGLRKAGASRAAEQGATHDELKAIFGWETSKMADLYVRKADQKRRAKRGMGKLEENGEGTNNPSPVLQGEGSMPKISTKTKA